MIEKVKNGNYIYEKLSEEEMTKRGILGRLVGNVADFINPTRNGRKYNEQLWEKVFSNKIMQEKFNNKVMFGELGHPADRTEIDMEKVAVCMAEQPKKDKDGTLKAVFDILPTPNGRILKALCDYGSTLGVSSRGTGDIIEDEDGNEMVDPDTYDCECWDIVLVPAVESARLQYVTESLDTKKTSLKRALCESLDKANADERKVMEETLHNLGLNVEENPHEDKLTESKSSEQTNEKSKEASNDGSEEIIKSLQEALKNNAELEVTVKSLQEQLAVANSKVNLVKEELGRYKSATVRLSTMASEKKALTDKVSTLEEELKVKEQTIEKQSSEINKLNEEKETETSSKTSLNESISSKDATIKELNESLTKQKDEYETKVNSLTEELAKLKSDSESKDKEFCEKLDSANKLAENWKRTANSVVNHYIDTKAVMLGVTSNEIKNKLPGTYTIKDIDSICEDLQTYELNISKLPINIDRKVKVKVSESKNENLRVDNGVDDSVDDSLLRLAGIK